MAASVVEQVPLPGRSEACGDLGAVTAMTREAARAGARLLADGGNAVDAAVGAALVSGVVEPAMSGLGGAAYAVVFDPASERATVFEGSARCPENATGDLFEPLDGVGGGLYGFPPTRGDRAETGALSVCVPTAPAVLTRLHDRCGALPFARVAEPAIALAEEGFAPDWVFVVHAAAGYRRLARCPDALSLYTRECGAPFVSSGPDDPLRAPALARSIRRLAEDGPDPFYAGDLARRIGDAVRGAGGLLTDADFRAPPVRETAPLGFTYRGRRFATLPDNSGGPTLAAALAHLESFPPTGDEPGPAAEARFLHLAAESLRLAYSDRFRHLGDPADLPGPVTALLAPDYLRARRSGVSPDGPRTPEPPGPSPWPAAALGAARSPGADRDCTSHLNAMDASGLSVSLTATLGGRFGSAFAAPGLGYPLNNGMMWFDPRPGRRISPSPGRLALHAAAPTLVFEGGRPAAALGAPGGRRLISAVALLAAGLYDRGLPVRDAAAGPGVHVEEGPLFLDERTPGFAAVADALRGRGHEVVRCEETALGGFFGRRSGITRIEECGEIRFEVGVDAVRTAAGAAVRTAGPRPGDRPRPASC